MAPFIVEWDRLQHTIKGTERLCCLLLCPFELLTSWGRSSPKGVWPHTEGLSCSAWLKTSGNTTLPLKSKKERGQTQSGEMRHCLGLRLFTKCQKVCKYVGILRNNILGMKLLKPICFFKFGYTVLRNKLIHPNPAPWHSFVLCLCRTQSCRNCGRPSSLWRSGTTRPRPSYTEL